MAVDPRNQGNANSLSEEEDMATYYNMENDARRDEDVIKGTYQNNIRNTHKGNPKAGSSPSVCKYPHSSPIRHSKLYVVEWQVKFIIRVLLTLDLKITVITVCFGCLLWQATDISKYMTSNGTSRE
jgi:hypothetical protein